MNKKCQPPHTILMGEDKLISHIYIEMFLYVPVCGSMSGDTEAVLC